MTEAILADIISDIKSNPLLDGITISGGDPFFNPEELLLLLRRLKQETGLNIWCYTGYTIEYLLKHENYRAPVEYLEKINGVKDENYRADFEYIDVLVDGPFVQSLFDPSLSFRGSSNQRLIRNPLTYELEEG